MKVSMNAKVAQLAVILGCVGAWGCSAKVETHGTASGGGDQQQQQQDAQAPSLEGYWETGCVKLQQGHGKLALEFKGNTVERTMIGYQSDDCSGSFAALSQKGTFAVGARAALANAFNLDLSIDQGGIEDKEYSIYTIDNGTLLVGDFSQTPDHRPSDVNHEYAMTKKDKPAQNVVEPVPPVGPNPDPVTPAPVDPAPAPAPQQPLPIPASCLQFGGEYQMNVDLISVAQQDCAQVSLTWKGDFTGAADYTVSLNLDGISRAVQNDANTTRRSNWVNGSTDKIESFVTTVGADGKKTDTKEVFFKSKTPCNLINPSGRDYLTREKYDGADFSHLAKCEFWGSAY